jgi:Subtilase family
MAGDGGKASRGSKASTGRKASTGSKRGNGGRRGVQWTSDVEFWDRDELAYRPREVLVPTASGDEAEEWINRRQPSRRRGRSEISDSSFTVIPDVDETLSVVEELRNRGILAQPNHVLFSHCLCCGCGPHPAASWPGPYAWLSANPFAANPFAANPFAANPFAANPFAANPFAANPFAANPFAANPFAANPEAGTDVDASPTRLLVHRGGGPETAGLRATGLRPHSAHAATAPNLPPAPAQAAAGEGGPSIVVVDTGIAGGELRPAALAGVGEYETAGFPALEIPDEDPEDDRLDPVAGHGTFIAGVIDRIVPGAQLEVHGLLNGRGDANEVDIAATLDSLRTRREGAPALVNLSFGGYTALEMGRLAEAVRKLQETGTVVVASAGNDATCRPSFPAAFPGVVAVGALGPSGPAHFTNYGPWVRASAPGVDVVSTFFTGWKPGPGDKQLDEWVRWSGTSFATPAVVGALARAMREGIATAREAVERVIDDPGLFRIPGLGTVVNQTPWFVRS